MTHYLRFAALTSVIAACGVATALAAQTIAPTMARTDQSAPVEADAASPALTAAIRQALARARPNAAADPQESGVVTTLADIIVTADVAPVQALASVRLAIAEERCVFENSDWNRWGCAGLASVAASSRGATRYFIGSVLSVVSASTWSVTRIVPISAAMAAPSWSWACSTRSARSSTPSR